MAQINLSLKRAQDTPGAPPIPSLFVRVADRIPDTETRDGESGIAYYARAQQRFEDEATQLADALSASLPGGTVDALVRALLLRRALLWNVAAINAAGDSASAARARELSLIDEIERHNFNLRKIDDALHEAGYSAAKMEELGVSRDGAIDLLRVELAKTAKQFVDTSAALGYKEKECERLVASLNDLRKSVSLALAGAPSDTVPA